MPPLPRPPHTSPPLILVGDCVNRIVTFDLQFSSSIMFYPKLVPEYHVRHLREPNSPLEPLESKTLL